MLAYMGTRIPPKTSPRPNVMVRLCTIECCFSHPLEECSVPVAQFPVSYEMRSFDEDMKGWAATTKHLAIWDYTTNFVHYLMPFPNWKVLQKNVRYFEKHKVKALFEQGNSESVSGELGELRAYLISRLLWNPQTDIKADAQAFIKAYYGAAAPAIEDYLTLIMQTVEKTGEHHWIYHEPGTQKFPPPFVEEAERLLGRAQALAAGDATAHSRVKRTGLCARYVALFQAEPGDPARAAGFEALGQDAAAFGITKIREWMPLETSIALLKKGGYPRYSST